MKIFANFCASCRTARLDGQLGAFPEKSIWVYPKTGVIGKFIYIYYIYIYYRSVISVMINHAIWVPYLQRNPNDLIPGWFMQSILLEISHRYLKRALDTAEIPQLIQPAIFNDWPWPPNGHGFSKALAAKLVRESGAKQQKGPCPSIFSLGHPGCKKNRFSEVQTTKQFWKMTFPY